MKNTIDETRYFLNILDKSSRILKLLLYRIVEARKEHGGPTLRAIHANRREKHIMLLTQNDPFRDLDLFFRGPRTTGPSSVPMDAYRRGEDVWVHVDLPGVSQDSLDIDVERSVLTISAERHWQRQDSDHVYLAERPRGSFRRQVHLGDSLDINGIEAQFADGVLTLRIPISERAKPKKISIGTNDGDQAMNAGGPSLEGAAS